MCPEDGPASGSAGSVVLNRYAHERGASENYSEHKGFGSSVIHFTPLDAWARTYEVAAVVWVKPKHFENLSILDSSPKKPSVTSAFMGGLFSLYPVFVLTF